MEYSLPAGGVAAVEEVVAADKLGHGLFLKWERQKVISLKCVAKWRHSIQKQPLEAGGPVTDAGGE
ncbi:hypothetical protein TSOC_006631 [Tetrabaena socialis]|uniref:Uncharacterized protein n=1 Tax=Tetrabaena socialis TaxID=47790 RepID=A0A2J8A347_9CHLO|nr:hypothetical protein TSOC_006631 [Tetrabaena socialis]|eukprot:PNH06945.1 hypothetical protein TSOC_006631 [Tetrabaena socialis]